MGQLDENKTQKQGFVGIHGARQHNLKNVTSPQLNWEIAGVLKIKKKNKKNNEFRFVL